MKIYASLPEKITTRNGHIYVRITLPYADAMQKVREQKKKFVKIGVLEPNLRGKTDLHNQPYKPNVWLFVQDHEIVAGTTIPLERAKELASNWHGGQYSAMYQFASSYTYLRENHLLYLEEIEQDIHRPETALRPFYRSKKDTNELIALKRFFIVQGEKHGIRTVYTKDKYGIPFPQLHDSFPDEQVNTIKEIKRMP
jgi:hypothetical protein